MPTRYPEKSRPQKSRPQKTRCWRCFASLPKPQDYDTLYDSCWEQDPQVYNLGAPRRVYQFSINLRTVTRCIITITLALLTWYLLTR